MFSFFEVQTVSANYFFSYIYIILSIKIKEIFTKTMKTECKAVEFMSLINILKTGIYHLPQATSTLYPLHFFLLHNIIKAK